MTDHPTAQPAPSVRGSAAHDVDLDAAITRAGVADLTAAHHIIGPTALSQVRASLDDVLALVEHARALRAEVARLREVNAENWNRAFAAELERDRLRAALGGPDEGAA